MIEQTIEVFCIKCDAHTEWELYDYSYEKECIIYDCTICGDTFIKSIFE